MSSADFALPRRRLPVAALSMAISALRYAILVTILLLLSPYLLAHFDNPRGHFVTDFALRQRDDILQVAGRRLREYLPTRISGKDRSDWILMASLIGLAIGAGSIRDRVVRRSAARQVRRQVESWKAALKQKGDTTAASALDAQFKEFETSKNADRGELLRAFAEAKKRLDALGREVAFLSIDVVDSTAMKHDEESGSVQYDFAEYRKFVEAIFRARGVLKAAWTPDGVMACFAEVDDAIQAGKNVINGLEHFNRVVKLMKRDFVVRCGVNAGYVHFDDATPLETMSDRVIDIAGHMQKYAEPNTVAVARKVVEPLRNAEGFQSTGKVVDGFEVSCWFSGKA